MQSDTKSFILRIWIESEADQDNPNLWRGVVEQVGSRKRLYFQDLGRAILFIQEQAGIGLRSASQRSKWKLFIAWVRNAIHLHHYE